MNTPQFKIHGEQRRVVKKELGELKRYIKNFWHYHQLDKDMVSFYGGKEDYPMSDGKAQMEFDIANGKIKLLEEKLAVPFGNTNI